jgi:hypothetical protein
MNKACLNCHGASISHDISSMTARHGAVGSLSEKNSSCAHCHTEHEGTNGLLEIADAQCITCHSDLKSMQATTTFASTIRDFGVSHPEFRILADRAPDPGRLKLNHAVHLKPNLLGPDRTPVQMVCADCHRPTNGGGVWPYGRNGKRKGAATSKGHSHSPAVEQQSSADPVATDGALMQPIQYAKHCAACHPLVADPERRILPGGEIPHESPERIRVFLRGMLSAFADNHSEALQETPNSANPGLPTMRSAESVEERFKTAWVNDRIVVFEQRLYRNAKDCRLCHDQEWSADVRNLPRIVPPDVPSKWLEHASFDHERHKVLSCDACHTAARTSTKTGDVLLPGIASCRACHAPSSDRLSGAGSDCVLCHTYHPSAISPYGTGLDLDALTSNRETEDTAP